MDTIIGQPIDRRDGRLKVTGRATYAAEFAVPDLAHAALVQSTIANGSIVAIDTDAAERMPGVLAVITPNNADKLHLETKSQQTVTKPTLQDREVLFNGQHVGIVVADTLERALAAAAAVRVRYEQGEAITRMEPVLSTAYPPKHFRNGQRPPDSSRGDPDGAFASAPVRLEATYTTPIEHHNPMEPHATIARWDGDKLTVWTATQGISWAQTALASLFGIPPENVTVICPFVGGGFGCKGNTWPPATLTAMAARKVGRPVKLNLTRADMYTSNGYRPRTIQKLRFAADADGKLVSMRHDGFTQMSMPSLGEFAEPVGLATEMLYGCPNVAVTHRLVPINAGLPTYMRAPGEASGVFALESAMDELAVALKIDPVEFRIRNDTAVDLHEKKPFSSRRLRECLEQGAELFGWSRRTPEPRSMRDGRMLVGMGVASSTYPTNRSPASASVRLNADGTVLVRSGTQDLGTGTYTVISQVAAEALRVPVGRIRFELGDSRFPSAPVSGGSQTVASVSSAVLAACEAATQQVFEAVRGDPELSWGLAGGELRFENLTVLAPGRRIALAQVLARQGRDRLEVEAHTDAGHGKEHHSLHAFGAQFAEVRVDPDLGTIRVSRYVGVFDAGRILNAKLARSQMLGGITYGLGMALFEATEMDAETGRIVNANIAEYLVPVNADVPAIEVLILPGDDPIPDPLGAKGIGELPMVGVAPAVANAVYHATGVRVRDLPIRIEQLLA
jgi:xanthine dehydrogenase YagR molybdenum-binding subunit